MTPADTSNESDVQNEWEENTHTHATQIAVSKSGFVCFTRPSAAKLNKKELARYAQNLPNGRPVGTPHRVGSHIGVRVVKRVYSILEQRVNKLNTFVLQALDSQV